jgi:hypothetical protein
LNSLAGRIWSNKNGRRHKARKAELDKVILVVAEADLTWSLRILHARTTAGKSRKEREKTFGWET